MGQAAMQGGQDRGNYLTQMGNAQAAGYVGQANAINNGISQGVNSYNNYQNMNKLNPQQTQPVYSGNEGDSNFMGPRQ